MVAEHVFRHVADDALVTALHTLPVPPYRVDYLTLTADGESPPTRKHALLAAQRSSLLDILPLRAEVHFAKHRTPWYHVTDFYGYSVLYEDERGLSAVYEITFVGHDIADVYRGEFLPALDSLLAAGHRIADGDLWLSTVDHTGCVPGARLLLGGAARRRRALITKQEANPNQLDIDVFFVPQIGHRLGCRAADVYAWLHQLQHRYESH